MQSNEDDENYEYKLLDEAYLDDCVTGNGSGSYWYSTWRAEEAICHNLYLYNEAKECFGYGYDDLDAEKIDIAIRCYLLSDCFHRAFTNFVNSLK